MSKWISVEDALPKDSRYYQIYCEDTKEQFVGFHHGEGKFQFGRYKDSVTDIQLLCLPSHWADTPEPPK